MPQKSLPGNHNWPQPHINAN